MIHQLCTSVSLATVFVRFILAMDLIFQCMWYRFNRGNSWYSIMCFCVCIAFVWVGLWRAFDIWLKVRSFSSFSIKTFFSLLSNQYPCEKNDITYIKWVQFLNKSTMHCHVQAKAFFAMYFNELEGNENMVKNCYGKIDWISINNFVFEMDSLEPSIGFFFN